MRFFPSILMVIVFAVLAAVAQFWIDRGVISFGDAFSVLLLTVGCGSALVGVWRGYEALAKDSE